MTFVAAASNMVDVDQMAEERVEKKILERNQTKAEGQTCVARHRRMVVVKHHAVNM